MTLLVILSKNMCSKHSYVYGETLHYARNTSNKEDFVVCPAKGRKGKFPAEGRKQFMLKFVFQEL